MISQMTSSATLRVLLKGALNTGIPTAFAACSACLDSGITRHVTASLLYKIH